MTVSTISCDASSPALTCKRSELPYGNLVRSLLPRRLGAFVGAEPPTLGRSDGMTTHGGRSPCFSDPDGFFGVVNAGSLEQPRHKRRQEG